MNIFNKTIKLDTTVFNNSSLKSFTFLFCPFENKKIPIRCMKTMKGQNLFIETVRQERLSQHISKCFDVMFSTPIKSKTEFLDRVVKYSQNETLGENISKQSMLKGMFPRFSTRKEDIILAMKNHDPNCISNKLHISNLKEKSDVRFLVETKTASEFSNTSDTIKKIVMNSENPSTATINPSGSNKYPDITININSSQYPIDIKSGNNRDNIFGATLAEIPYCENGKVYNIMNNDLSLDKIQEQRIAAFERENLLFLLHESVKNIYNSPSIEIIQKNILIQEEFYKYMSVNPNQKLSLFYGSVIKNHLGLNYNFHKRLSPFINDRIFDSKDHFYTFMRKAKQIYNEEVSDIIINIRKSQAFWMGTGFEKIADDIFEN